jgi:hypothetical protein
VLSSWHALEGLQSGAGTRCQKLELMLVLVTKSAWLSDVYTALCFEQGCLNWELPVLNVLDLLIRFDVDLLEGQFLFAFPNQ